MGTASGSLKEDAVCLTWRSDTHPFIVHPFHPVEQTHIIIPFLPFFIACKEYTILLPFSKENQVQVIKSLRNFIQRPAPSPCLGQVGQGFGVRGTRNGNPPALKAKRAGRKEISRLLNYKERALSHILKVPSR
jgi:hypothetical protein